MKKLIAATFGFAVLMCTGPALATITYTYHWQQVGHSSSITSSWGEIKIFGSAWDSGHILYSDMHVYPFLPPPITSPIQSIIFGVNVWQSPVVIYPLTNQAPWYLDVNLYPTPNGGLDGKISATNIESTVVMGGSLAGWTITSFSSDNGATGCLYPCSGATGYWRLTVPEPAMLPIFAIYAMGLLIIYRKVGSAVASFTRT